MMKWALLSDTLILLFKSPIANYHGNKLPVWKQRRESGVMTGSSTVTDAERRVPEIIVLEWGLV
jgi:hypothetical protein